MYRASLVHAPGDKASLGADNSKERAPGATQLTPEGRLRLVLHHRRLVRAPQVPEAEARPPQTLGLGEGQEEARLQCPELAVEDAGGHIVNTACGGRGEEDEDEDKEHEEADDD